MVTSGEGWGGGIVRDFAIDRYTLLSFFLPFFWLHWALVVACGIQFPDQGSNPGPLHWERGVLTTGPPGKSPFCFI